MRDLTEQLSTDIAKAINKFRDELEEAQRLIALAQTELTAEIQSAHQAFEVHGGLRIESAHRDMAAQITAFLGQAKEPTAKPETLPDMADGPVLAQE